MWQSKWNFYIGATHNQLESDRNAKPTNFGVYMKFITLMFALSSLPTFAASIHSAKLDATQENLLIDVSYGGGCRKHEFSVRVYMCGESFPLSCNAKLVEKIEGGADHCEAIISETVKINLKANDLADDFYRDAVITIEGDRNYRGETTSATVRLP